MTLAHALLMVLFALQQLAGPAIRTPVCSADGTAFTVSWDPLDGATSYYLRVDYLANGSVTWTEPDYYVDLYTLTTFTAPVIQSQAYHWWVHGANADGVGPATHGDFICQVPLVNDVANPSIAIAIVGGKASLTWDPNKETYLAGYNVYRATGITAGEYTKLNPELLTVASYLDPTIEIGKSYWFYITAVGTEAQESPPSAKLFVTVP